MIEVLLILLCVIITLVLLVLWVVFRNSEEKNLSAERIETMVWILYSRVTKDPELAPYFQDVSVPDIVRHQTLMFRGLLLPNYLLPRYNIANIHKNLDVKDAHFTLLLRYVKDILQEYNVNSAEVQRVLTLLETYRSEIVKSK